MHMTGRLVVCVFALVAAVVVVGSGGEEGEGGVKGVRKGFERLYLESCVC